MDEPKEPRTPKPGEIPPPPVTRPPATPPPPSGPVPGDESPPPDPGPSADPPGQAARAGNELSTRARRDEEIDAESDDEVDEDALPPRPDEKPSASEERVLGMLCHLLALIGLVVGPFVLWILKKDTSPLVRREGRKSINFQILFALAFFTVWIGLEVMSYIPVLGMLFEFLKLTLLSLLILADMALVIVAALRVHEGKEWRYPVNYDFIKALSR